ncbi:MAG: glycoside hydrolase family 97 N-terminal domain-containing protein, partial [Parvibaculales bacterium]
MRVFLILFLLPCFASAFEVESPDGGVVVSLEVRGGEAIYQISAGGKAVVLPSKLGFLWEGSARVRRISEEGVSSCAPPLRCRYGVFRLHYDNAPDVLLHLRLWGDGVAWRYQVLSWRGVRVRG